jgi:nucleoside-diphosphate-sugar epimerase
VDLIVTSRHPSSLDLPGAKILHLDTSAPFQLDFIPHGAAVLHSIPSSETGDPTAAIVSALSDRPSRVVYLSTTGVYGAHAFVDEETAPNPAGPRMQWRVDAEHAILNGPWSGLVLRPAAIYGPGRGVHVSMASGKWQLPGDGHNFVSRIHVEDLAALATEALFRTGLTGAYPVADEEPCTSREMAEFCASLLGMPVPEAVPVSSLHPTRRADRRVDGRALRNALGVTLKYPSYRVGIPLAISAENKVLLKNS